MVVAGAGLIAIELLIMIGLLSNPAAMDEWMRVEAWYVLAVLLSPVGYVMQDVVADAMTVEAVPRFGPDGQAIDDAQQRSMHTTMQTLGRIAIVGGGLLVALLNVGLLGGASALPEAEQAALYVLVHQIALLIPVCSVSGVALAWWLAVRERRRLRASGMAKAELDARMGTPSQPPPVNLWVLGGGAGFAALSITVGLGDFRWAQELVFAVSMTIILTLIVRLTRELEPHARRTLIGTAIVIFVFRALPTPGPGQTWWMIDELGFDQQFLAVLSLIAGVLALGGLLAFRRFMAEQSIYRIVGILTIVGALLTAPVIGMYYGLHHWTAMHTGGIVDARFIAIVDTALESPLGQIAMVPMLAWIAGSAPDRLKATFFAVMASFTNLALSASQLGTRYLNQFWTVTREVRDTASGSVKVAADYSQLGELMLVSVSIALVAPLLAIVVVRLAGLRSA